MLPTFITFTGVDATTDPAALVALAKDYPVEFGVLFSPKRHGAEPRYPHVDVIRRLVDSVKLRWAAHLCGGDALAAIKNAESPHDALLQQFQRVQINTRDPSVDPEAIGRWAGTRNLRAILQCHGPFPQVAAVDVLFDASGGRGISPPAWPSTVNTTFCGFAGGLAPNNVATAVEAITRGADRYWIDMESGVRDEHDRFDIHRCRAVCEAVYGAPLSIRQA